MTNQNKVIAMAMLKLAIQHRYSETPINTYIKFMDKLSKKERNKILSDKKITVLIDKINRYTDDKIELNKSRRK
jgi:hypothetical protein